MDASEQAKPADAVGSSERLVPEPERAAFEDWARRQGHHLARSELRRDWYGNTYTNDAWQAWQAAAAAGRERLAAMFDACSDDDRLRPGYVAQWIRGA